VPVGGVMVMLATGIGMTVTIAVPVLFSTAAEMVTLPAATPSTTPVVAFTVATAGFDDAHVGNFPDTKAPFWSCTSALSVVLWLVSTVATSGVTETADTNGVVG
jgi:hypothetical protein